MTATFPPIFDGHNDTVGGIRKGRSFFERGTPDASDFSGGAGGHIDLPRAREGGLGGGFFAIYIADPSPVALTDMTDEQRTAAFRRYSDPANYPDPMPVEYAQSEALAMLGTLFKIERESNGEVKIVRTAAELEQCLQDGTFAIELHFECAPQLDAAGYAIEVFHAAGLRSVGLVHSRRNIFAEGVPFKFPGDPDTGPGLTDLGKELVRQLNRKKILIDLSHLNEKGFWDVAAISDAPLVATHSNAWELTNAPRNLTDRQMEAIKESNGVAGLNFHVGFLRDDGERNPNMPISRMVDHLEYMIDKMGVDCVALGSDFDGSMVPSDLGDAAGLPKLMHEIKDRGYSDEDLTQIANGNWVRVFRETWGE